MNTDVCKYTLKYISHIITLILARSAFGVLKALCTNFYIFLFSFGHLAQLI